jgi:hypothetical protein
MKGISQFISYTFLIILSFVALTIFVTLIYGYYNHITRTNIQVSLKQVAAQTADNILYLYNQGIDSDATPGNSTSIILSSVDLNYPNQVGGKNFEVELVSSPGIWNVITNLAIGGVNATIRKESTSGAKIIVKTIQKPIESYEYAVANVPIILQGKYRSGGNDTLRLVRYNYNGTLEDIIILGNSSIIIGITSIN